MISTSNKENVKSRRCWFCWKALPLASCSVRKEVGYIMLQFYIKMYTQVQYSWSMALITVYTTCLKILNSKLPKLFRRCWLNPYIMLVPKPFVTEDRWEVERQPEEHYTRHLPCISGLWEDKTCPFFHPSLESKSPIGRTCHQSPGQAWGGGWLSKL